MEIAVFNLDLVQRRHHKKRRINKKWLKRYGMQINIYTSDGKLITKDVKWEHRSTSAKEYRSCGNNIKLRFDEIENEGD